MKTNIYKDIKNVRKTTNKKEVSQKRGRKHDARSTSTCSSVSVDASCMANLKATLKYDRDTITNFKNQLERCKNFDKLVGNKGGKNDQFSNSTTYLLIALGGNMTNLNCSGNPALTENATAYYNTLANCSESIPAACTVPSSIAPNFTELDACKTYYESIETQNNVCLKKKGNATEICDCWKTAASLVVDAKALKKSGSCDSLTAYRDLLEYKNNCLEAFKQCKTAEDASVAYIMQCAGSANLNFNDTSSSSRARGLLL